MRKLKHFIEWNLFGLCRAIGEAMGIPTATIRRYFIYASCFTFGSPVIFYLIGAFFINLKNYLFSAKKNPWYNS